MLKFNWDGAVYAVYKGRSCVGTVYRNQTGWHCFLDAGFAISRNEQGQIDDLLARLNGGAE